MRPELEKFDLIDTFLEGKLSGRDLESFNNLMKSDMDFKSDVHSAKMANEILLDNGLLELKSKMDSYRPKRNVSSRILQVFVLATGVTMLGGFLYWLNSNPSANFEVKPIALSESKIEGEGNEKEILVLTPTEEGNIHTKDITSIENRHSSAPKSNPVTPDLNALKTTPTGKETASSSTNNVKNESKTFAAAQETEDLCKKVKITLEASMLNHYEIGGSDVVDIAIKNIKGGKSPYSISVNGSKFEENYEVIGAAIHKKLKVIVKDRNACESKVFEIIPEQATNH